MKQQQPLSYQTLPSSCWVTSVINGLLCLHGNKNRIPGFVLRLLHSVLTDEGVENSKNRKADWEIVMEAIGEKCGLNIENFKGEKVEEQLHKIDFINSVAICDISAGVHSILINWKKNNWYYGFDPDWDQVAINKIKEHEFEVFPEVENEFEGRVNVKINEKHLFKNRATKNSPFAMGAVSERNLLILTKGKP